MPLIERREVQLSYTRLTSPIAGVIGDPPDRRRQHHSSRPTTNGLVVVTQIEPISLIFTLPETVSAANPAAAAGDKDALKVLAYSQDDTIQLDEGKVDLVNNEILQTTGSIQIKANFPNQRTGSGRANSSTPGCCFDDTA